MDMYNFCVNHMNRKVRVHTQYGTHEGTIVNVDSENLYLKTSKGELTLSAWGPGYGGYGYGGWGSGILALSLFTLLAIALI